MAPVCGLDWDTAHPFCLDCKMARLCDLDLNLVPLLCLDYARIHFVHGGVSRPRDACILHGVAGSTCSGTVSDSGYTAAWFLYEPSSCEASTISYEQFQNIGDI